MCVCVCGLNLRFSQSPKKHGAEWTDFLAGHGIEWAMHAVRHEGAETDKVDASWGDYREIDLVVALRPPDRRLYTNKPATKLFNAWRAGVPAILGPEYAYREQRRSDLDYIEASSLGEAQHAVQRLRGDPELYRAMVENGRARAVKFTPAVILSRWERLLYETLPPLVVQREGRVSRRVPLSVRSSTRRLVRLMTWRPVK